jgi:hypothetical protein
MMGRLLDGCFIAVLIVVAVLGLVLYKEIGLVWHMAFRGAG